MIGQRLSGRYDIVAELGRGGMGVVYRAHDPLLNREVAIKLIPPTLLNPETEQRFQREAQLVAQMDHPAIVPIFDSGKHEGSLFFVMPVVQGTNLRWFEREGALTLGEVLDIGVQVAEALEYSHSRGVIHRDVKPENIMVQRDDGDRVRVRIMDFGLARGATESRITKTGTIAGTLAYMSPEQVAASGVDHRSDIYSLGTVLYECLTGEPPFSGELQSILYRIVHEIPQSPRSLGADINEDLETVILGCIAKEPGKRPQRASEVVESLRRCQTRLHHSDLSKSVVMTKTLMLPRVALSPFIGREKELAEFQKRLNAAITGECQFVVVSGEPGVGKTRLLDEIENLAKARKLMVLHGRSIEQDGAFPYQGFCEAIQEYFRLKDTGISLGASIDLADVAPDLVTLFPMLTEISEIRSAITGDSKVAQLTGSQGGPENRTQIFELLARTLTRIAGGRPLILFLEDLHAAEISIEALQYIVRRLGPTPTLIAATYRSTDVDQRHPLSRMLDTFRGDRRFTSIVLGPFAPSEHRLFLETLIGGPRLADSLVTKLFAATEGNPFFTKELVRSLLDSGSISKDQTGAWSLGAATDLSPGELPATIQQAVEKRIEGLPDDLREILSIASVIGKAFDFRDLETLAEGKDLEDAIDHLVEDGLIEEERESRGDRLAFSSGVVRDVLYGAISRRKRRSLHRRYAEQIEKRHSGRLERVYPQLVHHFSQGDVPDKTVEYGLRLAKTALDAFSAEEAARAAKTVLDFLDDEWEGDRALEGEARLLLAQAHRMTGDVDPALKEAEAAGTILERENQKSRAVAALLLAAEAAWQARKVEETTRLVQRVMASARNAGDSESLHHVLSLAATVANLRGEYEKANEYLEEAGRLAGEVKESDVHEEIPKGGKLVVALPTPVGVVEPVNMELVEEQEILANVFETLLATDVEGNLVPALCEKWEVTNDGTSFQFTLRDDVRFQDGHPLSAEDVKRSFERSIRLARELPPGFAAIRGVTEFGGQKSNDLPAITVHSGHKLEIELSEPLSIYPALLTDYKTGIARSTAHDGDDGSAPIGTGAFRLSEYGKDRIILERNREYWKGSSAALDQVEFRAGLSASEIASGLRSGNIDLARDLSPEDLEEFLRDPRFRTGLVEAPRKNIYFVLFNSATSPVVKQFEVRRALSGIVRTHDLVWQTLGRFAQPAVCLIPPGLLGHDPGRRRHTLTREEATAMLRSAGIDEAIRLRASVHPLIQDRFKSLLTSLFSIWSELGVKVEIATPTMSSYLETFQKSEGLDLFIGRWNADYDDPDDFTYGLFHSRVGVYRGYIASAEGDQILEEARTESRPGIRASLYRKYENLLLESGTLLPLFHDVDYRLANSRIRGVNLRGSAPYVNYADIGKLESAGAATEALRASGGTIQVPITGAFHRLDPSFATTIEDGEVLPSIFETLTRDVGGARVVPWLAAEFEIEDAGKRYRFHLRDDVRFHDGRKLTSRDVRYSFERLLLNSEGSGRFFYAPIRGAKALLNGEASTLAGFRIQSTDEFTIDLEEPVSFFPALIAYHVAAIVPEGTTTVGPSWQQGCVGTGPFRVAKFEPGVRLEVERNKNYWRKGYPKCEEVVFSFGVTPADILSEFRAGRFSLASDLVPADAEALRKDPIFASSYRETPRLITYYAAFNTKRGPLSDKGLRRTLAQTIDVASVIRQTVGRLAVPAHGLIPPGLLGHDSGYIPRIPATPSQSSEQPLAEIELTAVLNPVFFGEYSALSREIASVFRERGVKIRPVNKTMDEWLEAVASGSVDLVVGRWAADYPDADTFANILSSKAGLLGKLCGSPEIDRLIERGRLETSPAARHAVYRQIEEIIARDTLLLPLFHEQTYRFARPEVEGLSLSYGVTTVDYANLRIN